MMKKVGVLSVFTLGFVVLMTVPKTASAAFCSATNVGSDPAYLGQSCTACVPPGVSAACGDQWSCCTGIGIDNGSGGVHCDVSGDPGCSAPTTPTPTPQQECPTNLSVTCGNDGPNVTATFNWSEADTADRYILRVNRQDGENPEWVSTNDHWYYVDNTVGSCNGSNCTALLNQSTPKKFIGGNYLGWSVQSYKGAAGAGVAGCQVEGGPFSCTMPDGNFGASCTPGQEYGDLSYTMSIDNITNTSGQLTHATFFLNTYSSQAHAADLRAYLGSPTWSSGGWQGYFVGRKYDLKTVAPPTIEFVWSESTSGTIGSNQRTINELANWMQENYPDVQLEFGANLNYNNVQNDWIGLVDLSITPSACVEGAGWGVDNVSVCWDGSTLGASDIAPSVGNGGQVSISPINQKSNSRSFVNKVLSVISRVL